MVLKTTVLKTFNVWRKLLMMEFTVVEVTVCYGLLSSCYLGMLDNLKEWICSTVCPSIATSLEPLAHSWHAASLSLFYWNYSGRRSSELDELISLPYSPVWFTLYCKRQHDFTITISMLLGWLYQQFLYSHSYTLKFFTCRMLSFDLLSKWLSEPFIFGIFFIKLCCFFSLNSIACSEPWAKKIWQNWRDQFRCISLVNILVKSCYSLSLHHKVKPNSAYSVNSTPLAQTKLILPFWKISYKICYRSLIIFQSSYFYEC